MNLETAVQDGKIIDCVTLLPSTSVFKIKEESSSIWPNTRQKTILKAAILEGSSAIQAWNQIVEADLKIISRSEKQLLPLIYHNLVIKQGIKSIQERDFLKKEYLTVYANNKYLFRSFQEPLNIFIENKIPVLAIKGMAFLPLYYKDVGARPSTDIDILVPEHAFCQAAQILQEMGWKTFKCCPLKIYNPRMTHALEYFDDFGNNIDLHCHLLHTNCNLNANDEYWAAAEDFEFNNMKIKTLCHTDHLIHLCVHGMVWNRAPSVRWIADAMCILNQTDIDWKRLLSLSQKKGISLFLLHAFRYLNEEFSAKIPKEILNQLESIKVSIVDRHIFDLIQVQKNSLRKLHQYLIYTAYRNCRNKTLFSFVIEYLKLVCATDKLILVPFKLPIKIIKKITSKLFSHRSLS